MLATSTSVSRPSAHIFINPRRQSYTDLFVPRDKTKPCRLLHRRVTGPARSTLITRREAAGVLWLMWLISHEEGTQSTLNSLLRGTTPYARSQGQMAEPLSVTVFDSIFVAGLDESALAERSETLGSD